MTPESAVLVEFKYGLKDLSARAAKPRID